MPRRAVPAVHALACGCGLLTVSSRCSAALRRVLSRALWSQHACTSVLTTLLVRSQRACGAERSCRTAEASGACALLCADALPFLCDLIFSFIMGDQVLMDEVAAEIKAVCAKLEDVEAEIKIKQARAEHEEVAALRKKEEQLRTKEEQLRTKELLLLERERGALV